MKNLSKHLLTFENIVVCVMGLEKVIRTKVVVPEFANENLFFSKEFLDIKNKLRTLMKTFYIANILISVLLFLCSFLVTKTKLLKFLVSVDFVFIFVWTTNYYTITKNWTKYLFLKQKENSLLENRAFVFFNLKKEIFVRLMVNVFFIFVNIIWFY